MESKWDNYSLSNLYNISSGLSKKREEFGFGSPFLTFKEVFHSIFLPMELTELANTSEKEQQKCSIEAGDVFLTRTSEKLDELGLSSVALKDYPNATFNGFTKRLRPNRLCKEILIPEYAAFYFRSPKFRNQVTSFSSMTTRASLNNEMISKLTIDIPPLNVQKNIITILLNLFKKEESNKKSISILEELTHTLFKHWFIDFEFPNGQGKPYKLSGGEMLESELGEIPKGWNVENLSTDVEFLSGGTPKTKEPTYWNGDIPFFTPKDAKSGLYTTITEKYITDLGLEKCNSKLYPKNTVFITARGTVGKLALANCPMAMNQSCFALKHKESHQFYLYGVIQQLVDKIVLGANGAVFSAINLSDLNRLKYVQPPKTVIESYEKISTSMYEKMSNLEEENLSLQKLRDTLLPKLLSGEMEITDELVVG